MSSNGSTTIGEHLRGGMKNLLADTFDEVAQRAADMAVAQMRPSEKNGASQSAPPLSSGMTLSSAPPFSSGMTLHEAIGQLAWGIAELAKRNSALESYIAELKTKALLMDGGVWHEEMFYERGEVVTHSGAPWVANEPNAQQRPGTSNVWRLMGKSHR